ncbi:recombinase family protein [Canibacter sp. lx-45]|nr:recombinase family protein [Canibacter zhuwentaonis]
MGDALLQKTYTVDVLTKKRVSNNEIVPQYCVENNHEAIIPRQLFMQAQEELQRRAHLKTENGKTKRVYIANMHYRVLSIVGSVAIYSGEWLGKREELPTINVDALAELKRDRSKGVMLHEKC